MANPPELEKGRRAPELRRSVKPLDWSRLFRAASPEAALEELGPWLGPDVLRLRLYANARPGNSLGEWSRAASATPVVDREVECGGRSGLRLVVSRTRGCSEWASLLARARLALDGWRVARRELERSERRLAARSGELDLLQTLGRRAAEAQTLPELFGTTVSVLQPCIEFDLALTASRGEGAVGPQIFLARPFDDFYLAALEQRARRFLGEGDAPKRPADRIELQAYDAARGPERFFREEDLVLLPLLSRGQPAGCLIIVPGSDLDERQLRLLYSASNQLSLQMERIRAVHAAEAGRFRSIVESMPQGVLLSDDGSRVSDANRAAEELLESVGCSLDQSLGEMLGQIGGGLLSAWLQEERDAPAEVELSVSADRIWNLIAAPLHGDPRRPEGMLLVLADVTERRRIQEQLAQSEKMSSLGQMISGVAHELNNPLASILGYAQLLQLRGAEHASAERLDTLAREAERCRKIVQNLLSFARRREPERKPLSLNQVVETVLALMGYQLRVDNVTVQSDLCHDLPMIQGDAHQLEQALVNLLTNAHHAIVDTGNPGAVNVRTRRSVRGEVVLEVEDSGPGIPESMRSRIFDPFFTSKPDQKGTGLGLALLYGIVSDHDGGVELRSGNLGGARFVVTLPAFRAAAPSMASEPEALPSIDRRGRILVVDDEESVARMISDVLEGEGHETRVVLDAMQALAHLASDRYDLIISDLKMPGMNGDQLHAEVQRLQPELAESVLLTTGDTFDDGPEAIFDRTGLDVLSKPFDLDELRRKVRSRLVNSRKGE